jgi:calreticulin
MKRYFEERNFFKGLQTSQDARFYGISSKFDSFSNEGKSLVIQFTVKHEQKIDCGGGYVKVYPADTDQKGLTGDSPYHIMFGKFLKKLNLLFIRFLQVRIFVVMKKRKFM